MSSSSDPKSANTESTAEDDSDVTRTCDWDNLALLLRPGTALVVGASADVAAITNVDSIESDNWRSVASDGGALKLAKLPAPELAADATMRTLSTLASSSDALTFRGGAKFHC